ncbi:MAG: hypothetical protein ACETWM_09495 [Candidatus Lokiarchaeia archaeon]
MALKPVPMWLSWEDQRVNPHLEVKTIKVGSRTSPQKVLNWVLGAGN